MIGLLFIVVGVEAGIVVLLLVKTPLRRLVLHALDRLKRGRGPVAVRTVAATVALVLISNLHSITNIQRRAGGEDGTVALSPTDQVLWSRHLLEASLMGYFLFLALVIDRMHHYIRELRVLRRGLEAATKSNKTSEEGKDGTLKSRELEITQLTAKIAKLEMECRVLRNGLEAATKSTEGKDGALKSRELEITQLKANIAELEMESEARLKEVKAAEANAVALKKQSEGFLLEYDLLLEDNQNLRTQLQSIDRRLSRSDSKKNS